MTSKQLVKNSLKYFALFFLCVIFLYFINRYTGFFNSIDQLLVNSDYKVAIYSDHFGNQYSLDYSYYNNENKLIKENYHSEKSKDFYFNGKLKDLNFSMTSFVLKTDLKVGVYKDGKLLFEKYFNEIGGFKYGD